MTVKMADNLKIIFLGTPLFAVASLDILVRNNFHVAAIITAPDKPAGRGQEMHQSEVKKYAVSKNIPVLQPEKLNDPVFLEEVKKINADLQIVVAFRMMPEKLWNMPRFGTFNLHASLLPQYRGAAPINHAIINGEKETGVTTFFLKHEIDTGDILLNEKISIGENETAGELHDRLMKHGAELVLKTIEQIRSGNYTSTPQNIPQEGVLKKAPKIFKDDCKISWDEPPVKIHDLVRGLSPYPAAWTEFKNPDGHALQLKIFKTMPVTAEHDHIPGSYESDGKTFLHIFCKGGYLKILELQLQGKKKLAVEEWLRGFKLQQGWIFE